MKLDRSRTALVVVDVQEAFRPAVLDFERVADNVATLVRGARILGLPTLVTEQYPKGLGRTVPEVTEHSVTVATAMRVNGTAENRALGLHKMERSGAVATSVETALFELLRQAGTPEFKEVQALVK